MSEIYVHYGSKKFNPKEFDRIKNLDYSLKPIGGLWASSTTAKFSWKDWNETQHFAQCSESNCFKFALKKKARILKIDSIDVLDKLDEKFKFYPMGRKMNDPLAARYLNFEKLSEEYDVIEFLISEDQSLYWALYGWDCDSILVMNPDVIKGVRT